MRRVSAIAALVTRVLVVGNRLDIGKTTRAYEESGETPTQPSPFFRWTVIKGYLRTEKRGGLSGTPT